MRLTASSWQWHAQSAPSVQGIPDARIRSPDPKRLPRSRLRYPMRTIICCRLPRWAAAILAVVMIAMAVFASRLGFDPNADWGPHRIALLAAGILLLAASQAFRVVRRAQGPWDAAGLVPEEQAVPAEPVLGTSEAGAKPVKARGVPGRVLLGLSAIVLLSSITALYLWFVSVGYWWSWPSTTAYYDELADGFLAGSMALTIEPDARLAELVDPYPVASRETIPVIWDASYFRGKYYLYWGPFPAVILAATKAVWDNEIGDPVVVFVASILLFVFTALVLLALWRRFFAYLPRWLLIPPLVLAGVSHPILWNLNRPAIHEAAVVAGAAFFMMGVLCALPSLSGRSRHWGSLLLAGIFWGLALASRINLMGAVVAATAATAVRMLTWRSPHGQRSGVPSLVSVLALLLPLGVVVTSLAWYNTARFGEPLETGFRYQLTGRNENHSDLGQLLNARYVPASLYNYLARPVRTLSVFPFVKPIWGRGSLSPLPFALPAMYYPEQITGLLVSTPFLLFSAYLLWQLVCGATDCAGVGPARWPRDLEDGDLRYLLWSLGAAAVMAFLPLLVYFTVATRYLVDVAPLLTILAAVGSWVAFRRSVRRRWERRLVVLSIVTLSTMSVVIAFLLAVTGFESRFEHINPQLFDQITRLLAW